MRKELILDRLFMKIALHDDEEAFRILFYQMFPSLCMFAYRYVKEWEFCEDIVQDTFLKIWKHRKSIEITTSTRNYLITNVRNGCIDYLRRKELESIWIEKEMLGSMKDFEKDFYTVSEIEELLENGLVKLPEHIRQVFEMSRFEGKTYPEIANDMSISVKTVESYISKALKQLRKVFKDYLR